MAINRKFEPVTISKFNGMDTGLAGSTPEQYSSEDDVMSDITNFNTTPDGYLEKRKGAYRTVAITQPVKPASLRLLYLQRTRVGGLTNRLFATDSFRVWRIVAGTTQNDELLAAGASIAGLQWMVTYGGTASDTAYNCTGIRWTPTTNPNGVGGVIGFYGDSTLNNPGGFVGNSPIGSMILNFKNRAWIINTRGAENAAGHETKVWFSEPASFGNFGGAGMPNNFNLGFADGDYLVSMVAFNEQIIFFKSRTTYIASVDSAPTSWQYRLVSDRLGCVGRGTPKVINGVIYFLSAEGVIRTDGTTFQNISEPIRDFLDSYKDYYSPRNALEIYASYWDNKYILWMPSSDGICRQALVFNVLTENWTRWTFAGNVFPYGEAVWDEHYPDSLFVGNNLHASTGNDIWQLGPAIYQDNQVTYPCTVQTKKYDLGRAMTRKRNHLVGITVTDNYLVQGTYTVKTMADDTVSTSQIEAPAKFSAMNVKAKGAGYGRYFQTLVTQSSSGYHALYDITWMNEERGFAPRSGPAPPASSIIFNMGPDAQDKLDSGMKMG